MNQAPCAPRRYLVTGAGSGIGLAITRTLAERGHQVWAAARRTEDLQQLATIEGVVPIRLDVRSLDDVRDARERLLAEGPGLDGLVHNAGIGELGHLSAWTDEDLQRLFDVNVFGPVRLTRELMPLLLAAKGRVVSIGSMGGMITQPTYGPYSMTKFALEAFSECLRQELAPFGVEVSIVQPGGVATRIGQTALPANEARLRATPEPFTAQAAEILERWHHPQPTRPDEPESATNRRLSSPEAVAAVALQALLDAGPQARYLVGTRWEGERVLRALSERLLDAARSPAQGMDREALFAWIVKST
jgi:NAD(P)-dependent dehydrogenase (short-subunit alcohol dehydrogenase family)